MATLNDELMAAAIWREETDVQRLLDLGADVNYADKHGRTPLFLASSSANVSVVALLLQAGADVAAKNRRGDTALHAASCSDKTGRCAHLLTCAGASVTSANHHGRTPLHMAEIAGNEAAVLALLAAGASASDSDKFGKSPRDYAKTENLRQLF